jgi:NhaA family Na+:H+ antiporter
MSLFIGALAFDSPELGKATKIGVLLGSIASAVLGAIVLRLVGRGRAPERLAE